MKKRKLPPIDWSLVERAMLKSFRGQPQTEAERAAVDDAWRRSPGRYAKVNARVRSGEVRRIRTTGVL